MEAKRDLLLENIVDPTLRDEAGSQVKLIDSICQDLRYISNQ